MSGRDRWRERQAQAARDLEELEQQLAENEISAATATRLREIYEREMEEAHRRLSAQTADQEQDPDSDQAGERRSAGGFWNPGRVAVAAILATAAIVLTISVGWFAQPEPQAASDPGFDPSRYSNETMEAVISANAEHPQINGMRLALAGRYFTAGDFSGAFTHYRQVLERNPTPGEEAEALSHLGWMAWAGSGEAQLAVETLDRALEAAPGAPQALYFKAIVLWCGLQQPLQAVPLLEEVVEALPSETAVSSDLAAARAEETCR